jgi:hypothetical protein
VCRPYGACLVLYAYPALPRWATLVSRLRHWFIVCAEKQSRNGSGRRVRENSPMHVMRVILGILPLGILPLGLTPKVARLSVRMTRMCAAPTTGLASFLCLPAFYALGSIIPCLRRWVYCFAEKQSRDAVATIVRRTPRCGMVMRVILGILPLGLTPKIARRSVRMTRMCAAPTGLASFFMLTQRFRAGLPLYRACGAGYCLCGEAVEAWQWPPLFERTPRCM